MAKRLVSAELWGLMEPLIPKVPRRHRFPGRTRIDDRRVLTGILFVSRTGTPIRAPRRHPRSVPHHRLQPDLSHKLLDSRVSRDW